MAEKAGLNLTWLETPKTGFVTMRLILHNFDRKGWGRVYVFGGGGVGSGVNSSAEEK